MYVVAGRVCGFGEEGELGGSGGGGLGEESGEGEGEGEEEAYRSGSHCCCLRDGLRF